MAQQTIPDGLWSAIKAALTSNYNELYENKQSPVADDGTFTFLFGTNTLAAQDGNIRFEITADSKINVERYDDSQAIGEEWVLVAVGKMRVLIYADETKTEVLYSSHSDWQFNNNNEGYDLVSGLNTIDLGVNPITFGAGTNTCIGLESKGDLSILGETVLGEFKIYLERVVTNGESFIIATQEYVDERVPFKSEAEVFEDYAETSCGTTYTDKINATTKIKPAGKYRIAFNCDVAGDSHEVRFLIDGVTIHEHDTGDKELEIDNDNSTDWIPFTGKKYITLATPRTINLGIQHKNGGSGKMSNATVEIWRVG